MSMCRSSQGYVGFRQMYHPELMSSVSQRQLALDQQDRAPEVVHALLDALDSRRDRTVAFFGDHRPGAFAPEAVADDGSLPAVDHGETERDASRDVRTRPVYGEVAHCSS